MRILVIPSGHFVPLNQLGGTSTLYRLQKGLHEWQTKRYNVVLLTGGLVYPGRQLTFPGSQVMADWLLKQPGSPTEKQLVLEKEARDSYQNAYLSHQVLREFLQEKCGYSADEAAKFLREKAELYLVTEPDHGRRLRRTFQKASELRYQHVKVIPSGYHRKLKGQLVELGLFLMHCLDPEGSNPLARWNRERRAR